MRHTAAKCRHDNHDSLGIVAKTTVHFAKWTFRRKGVVRINQPAEHRPLCSLSVKIVIDRAFPAVIDIDRKSEFGGDVVESSHVQLRQSLESIVLQYFRVRLLCSQILVLHLT